MPGQLLYTAQWSRGLDGWPVSGSCQWVNQDGGAIVTDENNSNDILVAPYTLHISDYAIEVSIKRTGYAPWGGNAFGLVVRNGAIEGGYIAGVGVHFLPEHFFIGFLTRSSDNSSEYVSSDLARASSHLDTAWHRYRLEVRGDTITFLLDGKPVAQAHSDLHTQPGDVGIYVDGAKLSLSKFQIVALA